jgi:hypothetical protein
MLYYQNLTIPEASTGNKIRLKVAQNNLTLFDIFSLAEVAYFF